MKSIDTNYNIESLSSTNGTGLVEVTNEDLLEEAEYAANELLGVDAKTAFNMLDGGQIEGTLAEIQFRTIERMLDFNPRPLLSGRR